MSLYKPTELKAFLAEIGAAPMKFLSQNFLIDGNIVRKIVKLAGVKKGDSILEVGPGPGVLTQELLAQGATVFAVEKDRKFAAALHRLQTSDGRLQVFEDDVLKWDPALHLKPGTKLIANLPYNITTPILTHFLPHRELFQSLTVMVQKEVGERLLAQPGSKAYGSLSVFVQFYSDPVKGFIVEPTCFYPAPKVQSAVVQFKLKEPPIPSDDQFFEMTRRAFGQRRKMVHTTLKNHYPLDLVEEGLIKIGKGLKVRPEELSLADFLMLFQIINKQQHHLGSQK